MDQADPFAKPERLSVADAFERYAGVDLLATVSAETGETDTEALAVRLRAAGLQVPAEYTWSYLFTRVLVEKVEPHLGMGRVTVLDHYPAAEAALARRTAHDPRLHPPAQPNARRLQCLPKRYTSLRQRTRP